MSLRAIQQTVGELSGGRFVLGLGVSHAPMVPGCADTRTGSPSPPCAATSRRWRRPPTSARTRREETPVVIAALRPNMLRLAAERCAGAHPYNVTPEHTARAREILG